MARRGKQILSFLPVLFHVLLRTRSSLFIKHPKSIFSEYVPNLSHPMWQVLKTRSESINPAS